MIAAWHDPAQRQLVAMLDTWELRQPTGELRRGMAHVQLWNPMTRLSIVTPSRATHGRFEARGADGQIALARTWAELQRALAPGVPGRATMRAVERWFVLAAESKPGLLLRLWWVA